MQYPILQILVDGESGGASSIGRASVYYLRVVLTQLHSLSIVQC